MILIGTTLLLAISLTASVVNAILQSFCCSSSVQRPRRLTLLRSSNVNSILITWESPGSTNPPLSVMFGNGNVTLANMIVPRVSLTVMFLSTKNDELDIRVNSSTIKLSLLTVSSNVKISTPLFMSMSNACRYGGVVSAV